MRTCARCSTQKQGKYKYICPMCTNKYHPIYYSVHDASGVPVIDGTIPCLHWMRTKTHPQYIHVPQEHIQLPIRNHKKSCLLRNSFIAGSWQFRRIFRGIKKSVDWTAIAQKRKILFTCVNVMDKIEQQDKQDLGNTSSILDKAKICIQFQL